jgi:hypothetical protein
VSHLQSTIGPLRARRGDGIEQTHQAERSPDDSGQKVRPTRTSGRTAGGAPSAEEYSLRHAPAFKPGLALPCIFAFGLHPPPLTSCPVPHRLSKELPTQVQSLNAKQLR